MQTPICPSQPPRPGYVAPDSGLTHDQMTTPEALAEAARWVAGAGPWKGRMWTAAGGGEAAPAPAAAAALAQAAAGGGGAARREGLSADAARDASLGAPAAAALSPPAGDAPAPLASTGLAARLRAAGLAVHPYTLRDEPQFVPAPLGGDVGAELRVLFEGERADGVFADFPGTAADWLAAWRGGGGGGAEGATDGAAAAASGEAGAPGQAQGGGGGGGGDAAEPGPRVATPAWQAALAALLRLPASAASGA
jgi:hypothetical protein